MTWGLLLQIVIIAVGMVGLLRLTDYRDLREDTHRDRVLRARRDVR